MTYYQLDGITGFYDVVATDGTSTATVTFKDAPPKIDLDQVRNGAFDDPTDPGDWVNGNVGGEQGHYVEGYSIPYRGVMTDMPTGKLIQLVIEYDTKHSDAHAIDYLTYFDRIDDPSHMDVFGHGPETIDPLINVTGPFIVNSTFPIPTPSNNDNHIPTSLRVSSPPAGEEL
jgi:hypothetical protein